MTRPSGVAALELELLAAGYQRDTPLFEAALLKLKVERCQEQKDVSSCQACGYFEHCETAKTYLMNLRYNRATHTAPELVVEDRLPDWLFPPEITAHGPHESKRADDVEPARQIGPPRR